ncbi:probable membrane-associated kinase regulator 1 [Rutidosis leptorrhynchoides]|uniref:probable membrane-associated kinase regulator 1 n=1 Tax=Rutidosis leptorrhynchoides TaxID=125765 RepID=UPI003A9941C7
MEHQHHRKSGKTPRSQTLPSSPTHSSSSSDFEFTISLSPLKSSATNLCPADDLFYKGQLLPLHLSPRISMVRTLLLSSSSTSSSATTTARHSSDSHSSFSTDGCDSSRPSSVTDDELHLQTKLFPSSLHNRSFITNNPKKPNKYFSLSRFSSVFRKDNKTENRTSSSTTTTTTTMKIDPDVVTGSSVKRMSATAKEVIRKYLKKAKPLYEKLSHKQGPAFHIQKAGPITKIIRSPLNSGDETTKTNKENDMISHSFSGNLRYPRRRSCVSSCPSSMRSSPSHSGVLCRNNIVKSGSGGAIYSSTSSSMDELQSAIQGAIAHCKNSMTQN